MKKNILLILCLIIIQSSYSQQFIENTEVSLKGILYGEVVWINIDNNNKNEILLSGYDADYNSFSGIYSYQSEDLGLLPVTVEPFSYSSIEKLDYDNDGYTDFIISGNNSDDTEAVALFINQGNGTYTQQDLSIDGTSNGQMKVADLNNDGLSDIIITGVDSEYNYSAKLYLQNTAGAFIESTVPFFGNSFGNITTFDANNNGHIDVLITGYSNDYAPETKLYINDGTAIFTESTSAAIADVYFSTTSAADYDNDGDIDLLISGFNSSYAPYTVLYNNDGSGNFTENTQAPLKQLYWGATNFVDYDNDEDLDIFIAGADYNTATYAKFYKNTNGIFTEDTNAEIGISGTYVSTADWSDYDNDGDLDFVLSGLNNDGNASTTVYTNEQITLGVNDFLENIEFSIYPNPLNDRQLNLVYDHTKLIPSIRNITIYSTLGQKVHETQLNSESGFSKKSLDLSSLSSGIYVLQFTSGTFSTTKKIILD
jgi:hypothetical protein